MSSEPKTVKPTGVLKALQRKWATLDRSERDSLYSREFGPVFAPMFANLPLHGAPDGFERPRALVSVLGLSWQPVALMAAWCRPERMLVVGTDLSLDAKVDGEGVLSVVSRVSGVERDRIRATAAGDPGEEDIYEAVRDFLQTSGIPARSVCVDPTGGKKSMAASAALAGFLAGAPLVYVDYSRYDAVSRIPVPGSEYPRLLRNPLEVLGDIERIGIFSAFNRSDFVEAGNLAARLAERLYEQREAQCLKLLADGYAAWDRFDFEEARGHLVQALDCMKRFAEQGRWNWAPSVLPVVDLNLRALAALSAMRGSEKPARIEDGVPLLVWYIAAARRVLDAGKTSLAVLLTYATVERAVDLCLWVKYGLDDEAPDYRKLGGLLDRGEYDRNGKALYRESYRSRELEGPLMYGNAVQLLATLSPDLLPPRDLGVLKGLAEVRNRCEYEHGFLPSVPKRLPAGNFLGKATELVARLCGSPGLLDSMLKMYRFPSIPTA